MVRLFVFRSRKETTADEGEIVSSPSTDELRSIERNSLGNEPSVSPLVSSTPSQSSASERDDLLKRLRQLSVERRENPEFVSTLKTLVDRQDEDNRTSRKDFDRFRDFLFERFPLFYGYLDQPDRLINEIDMAMKFHRVDQHLDHLVRLGVSMNDELTQHNRLINQIEKQTKESGNLLTDSTMIGNQILGTPSNANPPSALVNGQKLVLNSLL